ncbi:MAG: ferritin-like domain-containing protein [Campylobacterota bacterium]|nr:ferritin-like domain-containing protein [Campylobacterota bacterium]
MGFFQELESIIETESVDIKILLFNEFYRRYKEDKVVFEKQYKTKEFLKPSYHKVCKIIPPQNVPKRKNLTTIDGQINLLHAIAHIEYCAIDLALDACYRFDNLPKKYYDDWLEVADDEVRHFLMLEKLLNELDADYGDVAVHNALFEASQRTQTLVERMAVVPRYLEANGLDATPMILTKLKKLPSNKMVTKIVATLEVILEEEIDHVKKGDIWFNYACKESGVTTDIYFEIIDRYYPQGFLRPKNLNIEARKDAGFSCSELNFMAKRDIC